MHRLEVAGLQVDVLLGHLKRGVPQDFREMKLRAALADVVQRGRMPQRVQGPLRRFES
jgi:hypothetical protein